VIIITIHSNSFTTTSSLFGMFRSVWSLNTVIFEVLKQFGHPSTPEIIKKHRMN
jgi:hypothetical protein